MHKECPMNRKLNRNQEQQYLTANCKMVENFRNPLVCAFVYINVGPIDGKTRYLRHTVCIWQVLGEGIVGDEKRVSYTIYGQFTNVEFRFFCITVLLPLEDFISNDFSFWIVVRIEGSCDEVVKRSGFKLRKDDIICPWNSL